MTTMTWRWWTRGILAALGMCGIAGVRGAEAVGPNGLALLGVYPEPTAMMEMYPLMNRLSLRLALRNDTGKSLTFESGKAFYLGRGGELLGTSTMGAAEFAARRVISGEVAFGNGRSVFGVSGVARPTVTAMALDSAGRIVLVGYGLLDGQVNTAGFALRLLPDGSFDPAFGGGSRRIVAALTVPVGVAVDAADRVVLVGSTITDGGVQMGVVRLAADGDFDEDFHGGQVVVIPFEPTGVPRAVAVDGKGRVVVGGGVQGRVAVARLTTNGLPDIQFAANGRTELDLRESSDEHILALTTDAQHRVVYAGWGRQTGDLRFMVGRLQESGLLDPTFAGDGHTVFRPSLSFEDAMATAVRITPSGRVLVGGWAKVDGARHFALVRFNTNGVFDTNFAGDGTVVVPVGGASSTLMSLTQDSLQRVVAVGFSLENEVSQFVVARFTGVGGLDPSFGGDGVVTISEFIEDSTIASAVGVVVLPDERLVVGGWAAEEGGEPPERQVALARLNPNGTRDSSTFVPQGAEFVMRLSDFPFLYDRMEQSMNGFAPKATPERLNLQFKFEEYASPLFVSGIDVVTYQRNPESYRFPLRQPAQGRWKVTHGHESGIHHEGSSSQRFGYDISIVDTANDDTSIRPGCDVEALLELYEDQLEDGVEYGADDFNECRFAYGEPIFAIADGVVLSASNNRPENFPVGEESPGGGNAMVLEHAGGLVSFYGHMIPGSVTNAAGVAYAPGDVVHQGDQIGRVGNSGHSGGPHLHFHLAESYVPGQGGAAGNWGEGAPAYFNNIFFKTKPGVGTDLRQLRTGIPTGTVIDWIDLNPVTLTQGGSVGPGNVIKVGDNDNLGTALRVRLPVVIQANAQAGGDDLADGGDAIEDVYRFTLSEPGLVSAALTFFSGADLDLVLYDTALRPIQPWAAKTSQRPETLTAHLSAGTYFAMVSRADDVEQAAVVPYQLELSFSAKPFDSSFGLKAEPRGKDLAVSWPVTANVVLESLDTLDGPVTWKAVTQSVYEDRGNWVLRVNTREPYRFFRLRQR
ncbi:MAG: peptidoglycan DD-metalloendopeptidase family protein [Verrucomicrobiales bacterium]|nr:peptidoglycan DD-metalloendopeptidase family protein [Verrucomicrobiales bacterium]